MRQLTTFREYCQWGRPIIEHHGYQDILLESPEHLMFPNIDYWQKRTDALAKHHRRLFLTEIPERQTVGNCSDRARVGDLIVLAFGLSLPLVIRLEDNHYRFVGLAEVDGLADGTVWRKLTSGQDLATIVIN